MKSEGGIVMDIHMATEISYKNGYNKAVSDLKEPTTWIQIKKHEFQCEKCKLPNNHPSKFCPNCGRISEK